MAIATASPIVRDREWNAHILEQLAGGKLTQEQALAQLKTAPKSNGGPLSLKQSEKGAVSVYGLQRMPVTLYAEQWERLLAFADEVKGFIKSHPDLARKRGRAPTSGACPAGSCWMRWSADCGSSADRTRNTWRAKLSRALRRSLCAWSAQPCGRFAQTPCAQTRFLTL